MKHLKAFVCSLVLCAVVISFHDVKVKANDEVQVIDTHTITTNSSYVDGLIKNISLEEIGANYLNNFKIYTHSISLHTSSDALIGYIELYSDENETIGLVPLTGDMIEGFDTSTLGSKTWILHLGKWQREVYIDVVENVDVSTVGKVQRIEVERYIYPYGEEIGDDKTKLSFIDNEDNVLCTKNISVQEYIDAYQIPTQQQGNYPVEIEFDGFKAMFPFSVEETMYTVIFTNQDRDMQHLDAHINYVEKGANLEDFGVSVYLYSSVNKYPLGLAASGLDSETYAAIDTNTVGYQEVEIKANGSIGILRVSVGIPKEVSIDDVVSQEAKDTMPQSEVVGVFELPLGNDGVKTWTLPTKLDADEGVDVYVYQNNSWVKVEESFVDTDGNVEVTVEQGSIIVVFKNGKTKEVVYQQNQPVKEESNKEQQPNTMHDVTQEVQDGTKYMIKEKAPATADTTNIYILVGLSLISMMCMIYVVKNHKKKSCR